MRHSSWIRTFSAVPVRLGVCVCVIAVCALLSSGAWAQRERKKKDGSGKSTTKRESRERSTDGERRETGARRGSSSATAKPSRSISGTRRREGATARGNDRSRKSRDNSRSAADRSTGGRSGASTRKRTDERRSGTKMSRERTIVFPKRSGRIKRRDDDGKSGGGKKKKDNPGYRKKIIKPGGGSGTKIDPRPGRYAPPQPEADIDGDVWEVWPPPPPPPPARPYLPVRGYIDGEEYLIHLPAGIIEPDEVEPAFLEKIGHIRSIGRGDSFLVCLFQTVDPMTDEEVNFLFERGVTFYRFLSSYTAIIDVSVEDIYLLVMDMPNFRWIGEYLPEYKYRHEPSESTRRGAYVHSLAGDSHEFRNGLRHIGIKVITYYEDTEDYYVIADWEQFHEISGLWWVQKVYKEQETFSRVSGID